MSSAAGAIHWDGDADSYNCKLFMHAGESVKCLGRGKIYTSDKGYEWRKDVATQWVDEYYPLENLHLFTSKNDSRTLYLTQDGETFREIGMPDGSWRHVTANDIGVLGVHFANQHEETALRFGRFVRKIKA